MQYIATDDRLASSAASSAHSASAASWLTAACVISASLIGIVGEHRGWPRCT
jgi:hypothetical protein